MNNVEIYEYPPRVLGNTNLDSRTITRNELEYMDVGSYVIKNVDGGFYGFNSRKTYGIYTPYNNPTIKEFRMGALANPIFNNIGRLIQEPRQPPQRRNILYFDDIQVEPHILINQIIVESIPIIEPIPIIDEMPIVDEPIIIPKSSIINNIYNYIMNIWKKRGIKIM